MLTYLGPFTRARLAAAVSHPDALQLLADGASIPTSFGRGRAPVSAAPRL